MTLPALDRIVKSCLAKEPEERWQNAADLARELKWIADAGAQATCCVGVSESKKASHNRTLMYFGWAAAAVFMLLLSRPFPLLEGPAQVVLWVVVGLTVLSGVEYFWRFGRGVLRGTPSPPPAGAAPLPAPPRPVSSEAGRVG